jgi:hypothetical protein
MRGDARCLLAFTFVVKMYGYSLEERVFIAKTYWITGSIKNCQRRFVEQFGGRKPPSKRYIQLLVGGCVSVSFHVDYLCYLFVLPTSFLRIPKTHNRTSLQIWYANVLHFCSFCKPTFSGATRKWDALYVLGIIEFLQNLFVCVYEFKKNHFETFHFT